MSSRLSHKSNLGSEVFSSVRPKDINGESHPFQHHVAVDVSDRQCPTIGVFVYNGTRTAEADTSVATSTTYLRTRLGLRTFTNFFGGSKVEDDDAIPYIS
jgi:hypothetical protein